MKKLVAILIVTLLTGCSSDKNNTGDLRIRYYIDNETGVEYILFSSGGIYPRLNADGTLYVKKKGGEE